MPVTPQTVDEAPARLRAAKKFDHVEIRKRFASISDPTKIVLVVIVDEGPVHIERRTIPRTRRASSRTEGRICWFCRSSNPRTRTDSATAHVSRIPDPLGKESRVSFPLTWGGERQAAIELDKRLDRTHLMRFTGGAGFSQRTNPFFDEHDTRERVWGRAERELLKGLRVGADRRLGTRALRRASRSTTTSATASRGRARSLIVDTRLDPMLAHNAVYGRAAWERLKFAGGSPGLNRHRARRPRLYRAIRQNVLIVRAVQADADGPCRPT